MNSTKSIVDKLNLGKYPEKLILNKPADIKDFDGLAYDSSITQETYDLIFIFIFSLEEFANHVQHIHEQQLLAEKGYLFFAYPKKNNPQYEVYIDRDSFFSELPVDEEGYFLNTHLKFSRMVSLNDVFTVVGLKSEKRKQRTTASTKASQCVDDYIEHVEDIRQQLSHNEPILKVYNSLTPGYQKDWARYVYSAKKKETQEKRTLEMIDILAEGYKSIDLYRRQKK